MSRSRKRKMPPKQILALPDAIQSNSPLPDYTGSTSPRAVAIFRSA